VRPIWCAGTSAPKPATYCGWRKPPTCRAVKGSCIYGLTLASYSGAAQLSVARGSALTVTPARSVNRPPVEKEPLARILGQLARIGGNLNQVAQAVNMSTADAAEIPAAVRKVRAMAQVVMEALGRRT
jgi:hypothetical protein